MSNTTLNGIFNGRSIVNQSKQIQGVQKAYSPDSSTIGLIVTDQFTFVDPTAWSSDDLLQTNSEGYVVSIADAVGYLYNDGSGNMAFGPYSGSHADFGLTANRAVVSNTLGGIVSSVTTSTEVSYATNVTSNVQTQLDTIDTNATTNANDVAALIAIAHWTLVDSEIQPDNPALDVDISNDTTSDSLTTTGTLTSATSLEVTGTSTFVGSVAVDTNVLFVNATTHRVGIGTVTPSYLLHVSGAGTATFNGLLTGSSTLSVTTTCTMEGLEIGTDVVYVDSTNHRVGINTSAPTSVLDVVGTTSITGTATITGLITTASTLQFNTNQFIWDGTYLEIGTTTAVDQGITIQGSGLLTRSDAAPLLLKLDSTVANGTNGFRLLQQSSNRLLFLTQINQTSIFSSSGKDDFVLTLEDNTAIFENVLNGTTVLSTTVAGTTLTGAITAASNLVFNDTVDVTGNFIVNSIGNTLYVNASTNRVGIGTASPSEALSVAGAITFEGDVTTANWVGSSTLSVTSLLTNSTVGTTVLVVRPSTSRVGINTATPTASLDVTGACAISTNLDLTGNVLVEGIFTLIDLTIDPSTELVTTDNVTTGAYDGNMTMIWTSATGNPTFALENTTGSAQSVVIDLAHVTRPDFGLRFQMNTGGTFLWGSPVSYVCNLTSTSADIQWSVNSTVETTLTNDTTTITDLNCSAGMTLDVSGNVVMTSLTVDDGIVPSALTANSNGVGIGVTPSSSYALNVEVETDFRGSSLTRILRADTSTTTSMLFGTGTGSAGIGWLVTGGSTAFESAGGLAMLVDYASNAIGFGGAPTQTDVEVQGEMLITGNTTRTYGGSIRACRNANLVGVTGNVFSIGGAGADEVYMPAAGQLTFLTAFFTSVSGGVSGPTYQIFVNGVTLGANAQLIATAVVANATGIHSQSAGNALPTGTFAAGDRISFEITTAAVGTSYTGIVVELFYNFT